MGQFTWVQQLNLPVWNYFECHMDILNSILDLEGKKKILPVTFTGIQLQGVSNKYYFCIHRTDSQRSFYGQGNMFVMLHIICKVLALDVPL